MQTTFTSNSRSSFRASALATAACAVALAVGSLAATRAAAASVSYEFTTTVQTITPAAPGFPASLAGVAAGAPIAGLLSFDAATPPSANPFAGNPFFGPATYYALSGASLSLDVAGVGFTTWSGGLVAFVWNGTAPGGSDGVIFMNLGAPDQAQFQVGNVALGAFADASLPSTQTLGPLVMDLGLSGNANRWLTGWTFTATQPVPEPASIAMLAAGLAGVVLAVRRHRGCGSLHGPSHPEAPA